MPMTKAFLDDFPREIRDKIYNVPIRKGQSPDALYHDTCIVMRGDERNFHFGDKRFDDLVHANHTYPRIGRQIDAEFTDCVSRFVPLRLQGYLERRGSEYHFEKHSLDTILPVEGTPVKVYQRWHGLEKSKGISIEADFPHQSEETASGSNNDEGAANSSGNLNTTTSPSSTGENPVFDGSSANDVEPTPPRDHSDAPPEVLQFSTEGLKEFCRRVSLLDNTQDLMIRLDTRPWNWTASDQSEALLQARKTVIGAVVTSIESIPRWHRYCVQVGDLAVFASRKGGSSVTGSPDYRITSETTEDWRSDAQYSKLLSDLNVRW